MSVNALFILIGGIIFLGIAGAYLFEKTRIPDVLILMGLGFILGPVAKLVDPSALRLVSPYFGTLALVVILFEGGLGIDLRQLISQFAPATFLTLFTFVLTMAGIAFLGHQALGLSWTAASILGAILCASPSPSISIPVISRMKIPEKTKTLMVLESGLADVLAVVVALALIDVAIQGQTQIVGQTFVRLIQAFLVASTLAGLAGIAWLKILNLLGRHHLSYMMTLGVTLALYSLVEWLGGSGAIAALVFGITLTNSEQVFRRFQMDHHFLIDKKLVAFHAEISFFIRTFFFVYLGWVTSLKDFNLLFGIFVVGLLMTMFLVRSGVVRVLSKIAPSQRPFEGLYWIMIPRGLTVAVLAGVPALEKIPGCEHFVDYAFAMILATNLVLTLGLSTIEKKIPSLPDGSPPPSPSDPTLDTVSIG
jgi:cell volume regulation protein A